jgi:hypothetical protein
LGPISHPRQHLFGALHRKMQGRCLWWLTDLPDEAPVPLVVMAVEEATANEGVAPKAVRRKVAKLAKSLAVHRLGQWAQWLRRGSPFESCVDNSCTLSSRARVG